jgi:hypothetical protein
VHQVLLHQLHLLALAGKYLHRPEHLLYLRALLL